MIRQWCQGMRQGMRQGIISVLTCTVKGVKGYIHSLPYGESKRESVTVGSALSHLYGGECGTQYPLTPLTLGRIRRSSRSTRCQGLLDSTLVKPLTALDTPMVHAQSDPAPTLLMNRLMQPYAYSRSLWDTPGRQKMTNAAMLATGREFDAATLRSPGSQFAECTVARPRARS